MARYRPLQCLGADHSTNQRFMCARLKEWVPSMSNVSTAGTEGCPSKSQLEVKV